MVSQAVIILALAALQYSLAVPTTISDVVPETRFVEHGDVAEGLLCSDAQPQAPRDLTTGASGDKRALGPLNLVPGHADATADGFVHVNTHFQGGAEHKSDAYNTAPPSEGPNGGEYANGHPGWQCADSVEEHDQSGAVLLLSHHAHKSTSYLFDSPSSPSSSSPSSSNYLQALVVGCS